MYQKKNCDDGMRIRYHGGDDVDALELGRTGAQFRDRDPHAAILYNSIAQIKPT